MYNDDRQVVELTVIKKWAVAGAIDVELTVLDCQENKEPK